MIIIYRCPLLGSREGTTVTNHRGGSADWVNISEQVAEPIISGKIEIWNRQIVDGFHQLTLRSRDQILSGVRCDYPP